MNLINKSPNMNKDTKPENCFSIDNKIVLGLLIVLCTNFLITEYTFAHSGTIILAVAGVALIVIGGIYSIVSTIILALLVKKMKSEKYRKNIYLIGIVLTDIVIYVAVSGVAYIIVGTIGRLTMTIPQSTQEGILILLLLIIASLSTFVVYRINSLIAKVLLTEENIKKALKVNLTAAVLYNPISVLGVIVIVLFFIR